MQIHLNIVDFACQQPSSMFDFTKYLLDDHSTESIYQYLIIWTWNMI